MQRLEVSRAVRLISRSLGVKGLKVRLQTFLSIPIKEKFQILSCDTLVANERYYLINGTIFRGGGGVNIKCVS